MRWILLTLLAAATACGQKGASRQGTALSLALDTSDGAARARIALSGLSSDELQSLTNRSPKFTDSAWQALFRVTVADSFGAAVLTPVSGSYAVNHAVLQFTPRFPFDAGRDYLATLDARELPRAGAAVATLRFTLPLGDRTPRTIVRAMYPSGDTVAENLLRIYIEFSAPMSRTGGLAYITLRDDHDRDVPAAFLPLEADFWNAERTRYTAFLDPGRVKQGILPNEQMGRAIRAGRRYSVVVDSSWRDAKGLPLAAAFRRDFAVVRADETVIVPRGWRISAPGGGTRDALRVSFPEALDHGLLRRALGVESVNGKQVLGRGEVGTGEREWRFTPDEPWPRGPHRLVVLSILEDPSGNRIDAKFEVDVFDRVDRSPAPERYTIPFVVR